MKKLSNDFWNTIINYIINFNTLILFIITKDKIEYLKYLRFIFLEVINNLFLFHF